MAFYEHQLDPDICLEATGGPTFNTDVIVSASGHEQRNANFPQSRRMWTIHFVVRWRGDDTASITKFRNLLKWFQNRQGRFQGFRFKDHTDFEDWGAGRVALVGGVYRLVKDYTDAGGQTYTVNITKPVSGTVTLSGVSGTGLSVSTTTGIVTNASSTGTWTGQFDIPVRFDSDQMTYRASPSGIIDWSGITLIEDLDA